MLMTQHKDVLNQSLRLLIQQCDLQLVSTFQEIPEEQYHVPFLKLSLEAKYINQHYQFSHHNHSWFPGHDLLQGSQQPLNLELHNRYHFENEPQIFAYHIFLLSHLISRLPHAEEFHHWYHKK